MDPAWSTYTPPPRGSAISVPYTFVKIIEEEEKNSDRRRVIEGLFTTLSAAPAPAGWGEGFISHFSPYPLNRRPPSSLRELSPQPDVFTAAHIDILKFRRLKLTAPLAFMDPDKRIGSIALGHPEQSTQWQATIMEATDIMQRVGRALGHSFDEQGHQ
ncbi:hypothetical protein DFH06DRAFT_1140695 [Mycena polygramma]|nr:hypothetical protein DFH06DRAFT_1140695 [Mycena polygramma]